MHCCVFKWADKIIIVLYYYIVDNCASMCALSTFLIQLSLNVVVVVAFVSRVKVRFESHALDALLCVQTG